MITTIAVALLAGLPLADGPSEELARLQGKWKIVREHIAKKDRQGIEGEWLIEGDKLTATSRITGRGKITLDPSMRPGRFEMTFAKDPILRGRGVYRFEGDKFITYDSLFREDPEPTEFPDKPDRRHILQTWRRTGGASGEVIDGEWELLERVQGELNYKFDSQLMRISAGEWTRVSQSVTRYSIKLNPSAALKQLDMKVFDTDWPSSETFLDVYSLDGDRLTVWSGLLQQGTRTRIRRDSVSNAPDSDNHFQVFERVKPSPPAEPYTPK